MAQKRMFDKAIIDTDRFTDLPMSAKAIYFLLGMEADDEGFVSPKRVLKIHGGNEDDIKILMAKTFIIPFESGVVVITDWRSNNWLDSRRIKPTQYQEERQLLAINKDNSYSLSIGLASAKREESSIEENRGEENSLSVPVITKPIKEKAVKNSEVATKYLMSPPQEDVEYFKSQFGISESELREKMEDLLHYCISKGAWYKNYKSFVRNALKRDFKGRKLMLDIKSLGLNKKI